MSGVYPKLPRVAVRDSFDDEDLSDVDDEVFIRDGKNGIVKIDDECGVKRPLMAPRRKYKAHFAEPTHLPYKILFAPFCYTLLGFMIILAIIVLCVLMMSRYPLPTNVLKDWFNKEQGISIDKQPAIPCTSLDSKIQWSRTFPKFTSEAPLRSNDVNGDNVQDIIVGFSIGLDKADTPEYVCKLYFDRTAPCLGGVLAINGKSGETIWTHWTAHAVFSVDCGLDVTGDKIKDCVVAGRGGILHTINGKDGSAIWELPYKDSSISSQQRFYDVYDARYIADVDDDGIGDVVASHTWQSDGSKSEVILVSGKSGNTINTMDFPSKEQLFVAPQIIVHPDGETYFILVANDQEKTGGLYIIPHSKLIKGDFQLQQLQHGPGKGITLPPLLIDINSDGTEDIIVAMFNSTVIAFDGLTFKEIWNYTIAGSEIISIPVPGYYNDDKVPDFMVKYQIGPGFPVYYFTTATVLDGKTGKPLLEAPIEDTMSAQMSGISVTVDGYGNDWFLHWSADCLGREGAKDKYEFVKDPDPDADLCKLRFNSTLVTSLLAFSQHVEPPGLALYRSEAWKKVEFNNSIDPRKEAEDYINAHPEFNNVGEEIMSNRSPDQFVNKNNDFRRKNGENKNYQENYYPRKNIKFDGSRDEQQSGTYLERPSDDVNDDEWKRGEWEMEKQNENMAQPDDNYDDVYDDEEDRLIASRQLNEIRSQRSEKTSGRYINNDTNDVENQLDPSMDYTNGQSKQNNYFSTLPFNRTGNGDDISDYMNIPDIDFVDNLKEAEALSSNRKRRNAEAKNKDFEHSESKKFSDSKNLNLKHRNLIAKATRDHRKFLSSRLKRENTKKDTAFWQEKPRGMQKQPPTGILLPSLENGKKSSVDLIFSTYWLPSSAMPFVLLPTDLECVQKAKEKMGKQSSSEELEAIVSNCLANRNVNYQPYQEATDKENSRIPLGQMTLYRMKLQCACPEDMLPGQTCKDISKQQSWPEHLGSSGSGYFEPFRQ